MSVFRGLTVQNALKQFVKIFFAWCVSIVILSFLFLVYYIMPVHEKNINGGTDYVWQPNSFWVKMTEGVSFGRLDSLGFNNDSVVNNPDVLVLGSSHMEAMEVLQYENTSALLQHFLKGKYSVYNKGISGHSFYKVCQYLPVNLNMYHNKPKYVFIESSTINISREHVEQIFSKKIKNKKSYDTGFIGTLQKIPFFRLIYLQYDSGLFKIFTPNRGKKINAQNKNDVIDPKPYHQLFEYLENLEKEYGTQIIIAYHPTGKIQKDGSIEFKASERLKLFSQVSKKYGITFVDLTDDFEKMFYTEYHVAHGFVTGRLEYGHLNRYGHECMAKAVYKSIMELEKEN